jgi:uncharacterized protein YaeQ
MTFVEAFHGFTIELASPEQGLEVKLRLKIPRHPEESFPFFYARVVAFLHSYIEGLELSPGLFDLDQPTAFKRGNTGAMELWLEVGCPDKRKLLQALRHGSHQTRPPRYCIYFYSCSQITELCHLLRGSKTNWIAPISFYWIPPEALEQLSAAPRSSSRWTVTAVDDTLYLVAEELELQIPISLLNMWEEYQRSLQEDASAGAPD